MAQEGRDIYDFTPPGRDAVWRWVAPMRLYFRPKTFGLRNLAKKRPALYVGNHTLFAVLDWPLIMAELYHEKGIFLRSLADRMHYHISAWSDFLGHLGIVEGSPKNCAALMEAGEHILVYPGGAREICKRKDEAYALTWKERTGFARMAIKHQYPIVPFASVGPDNTYSILADADDIMASPLGTLLKETGIYKSVLRNGDLIPPIARGLGLTPFPRPERFYFSFGKPIDTTRYTGKRVTKKRLMDLREEVEASIYDQIKTLLHYREQDTDKGLLRDLLTHF